MRTSGITLLEVLIAIFVVGIGLLGVLAVIPFGAYQTSKAQHAGYASNMLANAASEIVVRDLVNPKSWGVSSLTSGGEVVFEDVTVTVTETKTGTRTKTVTVESDPPGNPTETPTSDPIPSPNPVESVIPMLNCTKFLWIEPREMVDPPQHIFCIGSTFEPPTSTATEWSELMQGQDDLIYTAYTDKRPDFAGQKNKIQSSGKYTWFFTYMPKSRKVQNQVTIPARVTASALNFQPYPWEPDYDSTGQTSVSIEVDFGLTVSMTIGTDPPITFPSRPASFPPIPPLDRMPLYPVPLNLEPLYRERDDEYPRRLSLSSWYSGSYFTDAVVEETSVDVLACYNRVPTDDKQVECTAKRSHGGGTFTSEFFKAEHLELLSQTKYVFATWGSEEKPEQVEDGVWCKVVFVDKSGTRPKIIVTAHKTLPDTDIDKVLAQVYIPSGVLYHKRLAGVAIR